MQSDQLVRSPETYCASRQCRFSRVGLATLAAATLAVFLVFVPSTSSVWVAAQANLDQWQAWVANHTLLALVVFFSVYALVTALPLPVLTVMTLLAGALFGQSTGTAVAALAYTIGVTAAFLMARWLMRDRVRQRAGTWLQPIERGIARDEAFYLLTLRLMPSVPFFLVNVLMALTPIRTRTYALVSWIGVLPITFLYAGVGTELANLNSPSDVLSFPVLASLVALAVMPLFLRKLLCRASSPSEAAV